MARIRSTHPPELCLKYHKASELIGRRWTGAIIYVLLATKCRFATLRDAIPDITDRMLSERLQELEQEGIVERAVVPDTPVRVEYSLTKKGRALTTAVDAISAWADDWVRVEPGVIETDRARLVRQSSQSDGGRPQSSARPKASRSSRPRSRK
jgi:DNA-binding HxlR family transcriptional regulator